MREVDGISFIQGRCFFRGRTAARTIYVVHFRILQVTDRLRLMVRLNEDERHYSARRRYGYWFFRLSGLCLGCVLYAAYYSVLLLRRFSSYKCNYE